MAANSKVTVSPPPLPKGKKPKGRTPPAGKRLADDEFMAAAIGDVEWLRQSVKEKRGQLGFDSNGLAAVHLASVHGRLECLKFLIERCKVSVNLASSTGWRPVHLCISNQIGKRAFTCLTYLLDKGADHSVSNDDGVTPVHQAASEGHFQCLKTLIELGADIFCADTRGHMPIDLAKLWGHRNCARILATEMWHREKDLIARDMRQLKKMRMREVLEELEREEELLQRDKFYGKEAFKDWLDRKMTSGSGGGKDKTRKTKSKVDRHPKSVDAAKQMEDEHSDKTSVSFQEEQIEESPPAKPKTPVYKNPTPWNFSGHVTDCFHGYQPTLADVYPRDPLTKMPHPTKSSPAELNIRSSDPAAVLQAEKDEELLQELGDRDTDADADADAEAEPSQVKKRSGNRGHHGTVVEWIYSEEYSPADRQQLFACETILDQPMKRKWTLDESPAKPELQLHLSSDVTSHLFQLGLVKPRVQLEPLEHHSQRAFTATSKHGVRFADRNTSASTVKSSKVTACT